MSDTLKKRGKSLEDEFFKKESEQQLKDRREKLAAQAALADDEKIRALAEVSGLEKADALKKLADLDVTPDTIAAIALVPLVHVAWADGKLADSEREAILRAADEKGLSTGSAAYELLSSWLDHEPPKTLFAAWCDYIAGLDGVVEASHIDSLRDSISSRARSIASAAGGFLGIHSISKDEERALAEVEAAFPSA